MQSPSQTTFLRIFLRAYLVGAAYNPRGLQSIGFLYAMEPGLTAIHSDPENLREARNRYIRHHNCHPFWAPLLVGIFLHTESSIAAGRLAPATFTALKDTATNTLSALGDSVFGGTMLVTWASTCALLIAANQPGAAALLSLFLFLALQCFKICTFAAGLRYGLSVLFWLRRWDLINWGDKLKIVNALLLTLFLGHIIPAENSLFVWAVVVCAVALAAWLAGRLHVSRSILALAATAAMIFVL